MKPTKYIFFIIFIFSLSHLSAQDSLFIFMDGNTLDKYAEAEVDSMKLNNSNTTPDRFIIYHNNGLFNHYYTPVTDSIVFNWQKPALTQDSILKRLDDAYHILYFDSYADYHYNSIVLMSDVRSDDIFKGGGDAGDQRQLYKLSQFDTSEGALGGLWRIYYEGINRCNYILSSLDEVVDGEPVVLESVRSETLFLRAYYLHWLWKFWGDVFYTENPFKDPYSQNLYEANEIYTIIMQDIDAIIDAGNLPMKLEQNDTRASRAATLMLKARVVMYQRDESRYAEVLGDMNTIIDSKQFGLLPKFADIWPREGEFCVESIFEVNHRSDPGKDWGDSWVGYGTNLPAFCSPSNLTGSDQLSGINNYKGGWGFGPVRPELVDIFENGDGRLAASVNYFSNGTYTPRFQNTGYFLAKYAARENYNDAPFGQDLNFENNLRIFRYAEVLLNAAELMVVQGVAPTGSLTPQECLDLVRERAGIASIPATAENIKLERRREFVGEGMRFWDLVRWGDADILTEDLPEWSSTRTWNESKKYLKHPDDPYRVSKIKHLKTTNVTNHSAVAYYQIESRGKAPLTECWFTYSKYADNNSTPKKITISLNENTSDIYKIELGELAGGIGYLVQFYATNSFGTSCSNSAFLQTPTNISTQGISSTSYNSLTAGGIAAAGDHTEYVSRGLLASRNAYSLLHEEGATVISNDIGPGSGNFECELSGLASNTNYYLRAYVIHEGGGIDYGAYIQITTHSRISTREVTILSHSSLTSGGIIEDDGLTEYVSRGLVATTAYSPPELNNPDQEVIVSDIGPGNGDFECELTGLASNTSYQIRAYGVTENGVVDYGNTISIKTQDKEQLDLLNTSSGTSSKSWVINKAVPGHIGVGPFGGEGTEWFAAEPDFYVGKGLYDDVITFHTDGTYAYDPGVGGTVLVENSVTIVPYANGISYGGGLRGVSVGDVLISDYSFNGVHIVFPEMTVVSYIPSNWVLLNPTYRVVSLTKDELILLMDDDTVNMTWRFVFKPKVADI
ncbi:Starch-binding associating with outer membrane [Saccharicrinis carchari]|uniref:Starch-binding associating with outer membrane n=1 Tax=Saccharicrinis carchari TaxID=1168039 RepID=A0A521E234_SACCC|nr:RagB/SusD family nutrient uptake outer membrane protein [Saccharicrinis carchari]SMO78016.1 Starch-binding associating with outer membrane [Saccharicrinis carchari]